MSVVLEDNFKLILFVAMIGMILFLSRFSGALTGGTKLIKEPISRD